jgi:dolichyl-phosphate beta-glucosyltransferase
VLEFLRERGGSFEVIVVDDGSVDNTAGVVRQAAALAPQLRLLSCPGNCGKGYAVRLGILKSKGRIVLFNDADGATPIEEMERLLKAINAGAHVAIGSRALMSRETNVDATWLRKFLGRVFNGAVNLLVLPGIADTQCGFKMFVRPVARYAFSKQKAKRFSFDVEVLFLARKTGCKIIEVPVNWHHVPGSKINLILDAAHMLFDVITVRLRHLLGGYGERVSISELMKER